MRAKSSYRPLVYCSSVKVLFFGLVLAIFAGCSKSGGGSGDSHGTPSNNTPQADPQSSADHQDPQGDHDRQSNTGSGQSGSPAAERHHAQAVDVDVSLSLSFVAETATAATALTYADVKTVFDTNCVGCHKAGGRSPDLSAYPFAATNGDSLDTIVSKIGTRLQDATRPMPPTGRLADADIGRVTDWIGQGHQASPSALARVDASRYQVQLAWSQLGQPTNWQALNISNGPGALFTGKLPQVKADQPLRLSARVLGPRGRQVLERNLGEFGVPSTRQLALQIFSAEEDDVPPSPGHSGELEVQMSGIDSLVVRWQAATDRTTAAATLQYLVYYSVANDIGSPADAVRAGTPVGDFEAGATSKTISGLTAGRVYFVNVLVKDAAGNLAAYKTKMFVAGDVTPPGPPAATPNIVASELTDRSVNLGWGAASDDLTATSDLQYKVFTSEEDDLHDPATIEQTATPVGDWTDNVRSKKIAGLFAETKYFFNVLVKDKAGNKALYTSLALTTKATPSDDPRYDIVTYGNECAQRLGQIKAFNCMDGQIIPISVNGQIPADGYPAFADATGASRELNCDKPALLGLANDGRCPPYARLGRLSSYRSDGSVDPDVDTVFICRRYTGRYGKYSWQGETYDAEVFPGFEDIAIVQHSRKTGETCFFQMLSPSAPKDGRRVPPPTEAHLPSTAPAYAVSASDFWLAPSSTAGIGCISCHDSDPWVHSPYVDEVRDADEKPLVPSDPFGKYSVIGRRFFSDWVSEGGFGGSRAYAVDTETPNKCTSCHRIGSHNTCRSFARQSVGDSNEFPESLSDYAKAHFKLSHWMPPTAVDTEDAWNANVGGYKEDAQRLLDCCDDPTAAGCKQTPINTVPPPFEASTH